MRNITKCSLILVATGLLSGAQAGESDRILNLREIEPRTFTVASNRLFITVTGRPPHILTFTNLSPVPLRRRDPPGAPKKVQVTYGKDFVGRADVWVPRPTPKAPVTTMYVTFETGEHAAAAAQALRLRDATPTPLLKQKNRR
jgi:hypothetical protein